MQSAASFPASIRAVTFDVGGTLIEPWPSVGHVYAEVAAQFGVRAIAPEQLTANFIRVWRAQTHFDYRRESWFALVRETFAPVEPPPEFFPAVYDRFAAPDVWHVYEDVIPTLTGLRDCGLKLGIISNWDARLRPLLGRLGLEQFFDRQIISCEVGATKPDARLFQQAAAELAVAPDELLHVGDHHEFDVLGAQRAGASGLQLERRRPVTESWQVASLRALLIGISNH
jgi:putative hydrolase of the HAD superfamily